MSTLLAMPFSALLVLTLKVAFLAAIETLAIGVMIRIVRINIRLSRRRDAASQAAPKTETVQALAHLDGSPGRATGSKANHVNA